MLRLLLSPRFLAILLVAFAAAWVNMNHVPHHAGGDPFMTLYAHLNPEKLVKDPNAGHAAHADDAERVVDDHGPADAVHDDGHGDAHGSPWLLALPLPAWLGVFDMDHDVAGAQLVATNLQVFQVAAVLILLIAFLGVPGHLRTGRGDVLSRFFGGFAMWIRDEMVTPVMGKDLGNKLLPFFLALFFFILFMNLLGLVPGGATATASIFVTGALALVTLLSMIFGGMYVQGPIAFWKNLVPHVPLALWPLMFVVELIGLFVKPFALMIRLFANMTGGHLVVLSFMGLIFFFGAMSPAIGYGVSPIAVGFAVFIMIIEVFVALLQAYIFTLLSILFIHASVHPEH